jgi:hypothetical protein
MNTYFSYKKHGSLLFFAENPATKTPFFKVTCYQTTADHLDQNFLHTGKHVLLDVMRFLIISLDGY